MLDKQTRTLIAQRLNQAEKQREQIRAISLDYPSITIEDAYAVQREWVEMKIAEGRVLKGHKIGLTSKAMQASSQISEPDYGALLDDMFFHDGSDIPTDRFIVRLANDVEYGLASYIWTQDVSKVLRLARGIEAGMVFVNTQNVRDLRQPFGGVKASGTGREGGEYSFEVFAEMKNVCISMGDHPIPKWGV
ncbi:2-oxo-hepta-3-ene-1,7-dioic acid hydratase [Klebsiella pneumoniae]|nr:2-oxo-hepta-3-ene-1,7-dioic acid hydratase [Klebsiella pneumoniae]